MKKLAATVSFLICLSSPALAQTVLFPTVTGLEMKLPNGTISHTPGPSNYTIVQWDTPTKLPAFVGDTAQDVNAAATLKGSAVQLRLTSYNNPCVKNSASGEQVSEDDLFLSGNSRAPRPITNFSKIMVSDTVTLQVAGPHDQVCVGTTAAGTHLLNSVAPMISFALQNNAANQMFFYQVKLGGFSAKPPATTLSPGTPKTYWSQTGQVNGTGRAQFVVGDPIMSFTNPLTGAPYKVIQQNVATTYQLNVLPQFAAEIAYGARFGMDQTLGDWTLLGIYTGGAAWGHTQISILTQGFQVVGTP